MEPASWLSCAAPLTLLVCKPKFRCTLVHFIHRLELELYPAKTTICKQENIGYTATLGACAKPEMFVSLTSNAAGKSFCSNNVCILSHKYECLKKKNFCFFLSLGSVRDFYRAVFVSLLSEKNLSLSTICWSSLCNLWRSSIGPSIPEFLLTGDWPTWPTGELQDVCMVFFVPCISSDVKSKEKEYWCIKG